MSVEWFTDDNNTDELPWLSEFVVQTNNQNQAFEVIKVINYPKGALVITNTCKAMVWRSDKQFQLLFQTIRAMVKSSEGINPIYVKSIGGKRVVLGVDQSTNDPTKCWVIVDDEFSLVETGDVQPSVKFQPLSNLANPTDIPPGKTPSKKRAAP